MSYFLLRKIVLNRSGLSKKRIQLVLAALLLCLVSVPAMANVLVSVKPVGFIVSALTEGVTDTEILVPDGASPHNYALKPSDMSKIKNSDLVIWIGHDMEVFLNRPLRVVADDKKIELSEVPAIAQLIAHQDYDHEHDGPFTDPNDCDHDSNLHIWMSPNIAKQIAQVVHDKLVVIYPKKRVIIDENLVQFSQRLTETEEKLGNMLKNVQDKHYYVFHDAYGYFEQQFHLASLGYFTVNPEIQPGAKKLNYIKQELIANKAVCIFSEPQFKPAVIDAIAHNTGVRQSVLDPLGMNIHLGATSYTDFLTSLADQFYNCLKD